MRILQLASSNFKKIKAIDITPKEDVVVISGKNDQGKSSILDSIWSTLKGKAIPQMPIREGEKVAENELRLGENDQVKYIVTRTFTEKSDYLTVTTAEGALFPSPQKMLDAFIGDLAFDPLEFAKSKEKPQKELLLKIIKFKMTPGDLDIIGYQGEVPEDPLEFLKKAKTEYYDERTIINRELLNLEEQLKVMPEVEKTEKVSVRELFEEKQKLQNIKDNIETRKVANTAKLSEIKQLSEKIEDKKISLQNYVNHKEKELEEYITAHKKALVEYTENEHATIGGMEKEEELDNAELKANEEKLAGIIKETTELDLDIQKVDKQLREADEENEKAALYEKRGKLMKSRDKAKADSYVLSKKLKNIDEIKTKIVSTAKMPLEGLKFDGDIITYHNIPISQASDSGKLKISLAIAMALNPELRIIRISGGSLLDSDNMKILREVAKEKDFQIWIEVVSESGKMGFFIEEGEIVSVDGEKQEKKT